MMHRSEQRETEILPQRKENSWKHPALTSGLHMHVHTYAQAHILVHIDTRTYTQKKYKWLMYHRGVILSYVNSIIWESRAFILRITTGTLLIQEGSFSGRDDSDMHLGVKQGFH